MSHRPKEYLNRTKKYTGVGEHRNRLPEAEKELVIWRTGQWHSPKQSNTKMKEPKMGQGTKQTFLQRHTDG